jgi:hypothetical protein
VGRSRRSWNQLFAGEQRLVVAFLGIPLYAVVLLLVLVLRPGDHAVTSYLDQGFQVAGVCIGIALCFWNGRRFCRTHEARTAPHSPLVLVPPLTLAALLAVLAIPWISGAVPLRQLVRGTDSPGASTCQVRRTYASGFSPELPITIHSRHWRN